ncbi:DNA-processing protein DprA [Pikeienuella sp. HZG-20]|uniref:DNA-processing protein DprA n=1 Tax=Paludibacillus litoralis TaxID=3133267 RepID=UPI0030ED2DD7
MADDDASPEERLAWLRLARSRNVGSMTFRRLLARHRTAAAALEALPGALMRSGAPAYQPCSMRQGVEEMERAEAAGARMLRLGAPDYPPRLAEIPDPPAFLWALGDIGLAHRAAVAVVGARNASSLGLRTARLLAGELGARGWVVASGFARGIDTAAHEAALATGTVAALAGGVDVVYPERNAALAEKMRASGLLLSEAPMGMKPLARHFPRRNRIVSGLADGVVLIEAAQRSGSLITARMALEQNREVMAAPGAPLDPRAAGCNTLIRQGAALVRSADDVIEALAAPRALTVDAGAPPAPDPAPEDDAAGAEATGLAARALALLGPAAIEADALARDLGATPAALAEALLELELGGLIEWRPGGLIALDPGA